MRKDTMERVNRLKLIAKLITTQKVETQAQLVELLSENDCAVTQATLSRDIRDLGLVKMHREGQKYYVVIDQERTRSVFENVYRQFVLSVDSVMFMVVAHTRLGEADLLANEFDSAARPEILGTVAGADTLLIICANIDFADKLVTEIEDALK